MPETHQRSSGYKRIRFLAVQRCRAHGFSPSRRISPSALIKVAPSNSRLSFFARLRSTGRSQSSKSPGSHESTSKKTKVVHGKAPSQSTGPGQITTSRPEAAAAARARARRWQARLRLPWHVLQIESQNKGLPEDKRAALSRRSAEKVLQPVGFECDFCYTWHPRCGGDGRWAVRPFFVCRADSSWI